MEKAFDCKMCGDCCYGKGGITVNTKEIEKIAHFLDITPDTFRKNYCMELNGTLSIITNKDDFCIFFDKIKQCLINSVKPEICSLWPFFPANVKDELNWKLAQDACPGINSDCSFEEFVKQSKE